MDGLDRKIKYAADEGQMGGENEKNGEFWRGKRDARGQQGKGELWVID